MLVREKRCHRKQSPNASVACSSHRHGFDQPRSRQTRFLPGHHSRERPSAERSLANSVGLRTSTAPRGSAACRRPPEIVKAEGVVFLRGFGNPNAQAAMSKECPNPKPQQSAFMVAIWTWTLGFGNSLDIEICALCFGHLRLRRATSLRPKALFFLACLANRTASAPGPNRYCACPGANAARLACLVAASPRYRSSVQFRGKSRWNASNRLWIETQTDRDNCVRLYPKAEEQSDFIGPNWPKLLAETNSGFHSSAARVMSSATNLSNSRSVISVSSVSPSRDWPSTSSARSCLSRIIWSMRSSSVPRQTNL